MTLGGINKTLKQDQWKKDRTPQETDPDMLMSVQNLLPEVWSHGGSSLQSWMDRVQRACTTFEEGHHYSNTPPIAGFDPL